ncbi:phosphopantetheine-binding protein [Aestuariispira insulae]|uniref:Acyl carrier protein n=1 Tax=Aestuariispira insulae TaxID=1461337 RepID=A0A3D9H3X6_9PROT|nr:phosphopantetheine-binding protein [Aestuariispira insulae]RED44182.1 acyl carrier protein [Aestuariispira insulae]
MQQTVLALVSERKKLVSTIKDLVIENLELDLEPHQVDEDCPLFGVGLALDSIDALQLVLSVEREFDMTVPTDDVTIFRSINTIADFIERSKD